VIAQRSSSCSRGSADATEGCRALDHLGDVPVGVVPGEQRSTEVAAGAVSAEQRCATSLAAPEIQLVKALLVFARRRHQIGWPDLVRVREALNCGRSCEPPCSSVMIDSRDTRARSTARALCIAGDLCVEAARLAPVALRGELHVGHDDVLRALYPQVVELLAQRVELLG
jgi:hypothetical protein